MSNMDFFQIGALKVFAELGQLIEEDEKNQVTDVKYIGPNAWNEFKANINLDCIKDYINDKYKLKCKKLKIMFLDSKKTTYEDFVINVYHNETKVLYINSFVEFKYVLNQTTDVMTVYTEMNIYKIKNVKIQ